MASRDTRKPENTIRCLVFDRSTEDGYFYVSSLAYPAIEFSSFIEIARDVNSVTFGRSYETVWPVSIKERTGVS